MGLKENDSPDSLIEGDGDKLAVGDAVLLVDGDREVLAVCETETLEVALNVLLGVWLALVVEDVVCDTDSAQDNFHG